MASGIDPDIGALQADVSARSAARGRGLACAVSLLAHGTALVALAMAHWPRLPPDKPRSITSSPPSAEDRFIEHHLPGCDEPVRVVGLAVPPAAPEVEDTTGLAGFDGGEAASTPVDLGAHGSETTPADVLSRIAITTGFGSRADAAAIAAREGGGGDTEAAVDRALAWLDAPQLDDGSWSFNLAACPGCRGACRHSGNTLLGDDRVGATALAVLPFLGRGHTHRDGSYRRSVDRGISLLADTAARHNGVMYAPGSAHGLYVQGLAGIALSACYGMTGDRRLVRPTQPVIDHIMAAQDPRGGGWRYAPGQAGDTSVVGWQIMALTSAQLASRRAWRRNSGNSGEPGPWGRRDPRRDRRRQRRQSGTAARADPPVRDRRARRTGRNPTAHSARPADSTGPGMRSPS